MDSIMNLLAGGMGVAIIASLTAIIQQRMTHKATRAAHAESAKESTQKEMQMRFDVFERALRASLYDRIKHLIRVHLAAGNVSYEDRSDIDAMYASYIELKGNGTLPNLKNQFDALPNKIEGK